MASKSETGASGWFRILELCRGLQEKGGPGFTADQLAFFGRFQDSESAKAAQIASSWLGKFAAWGYLERGVPIKNGKKGRPMTTYALTDAGMDCEERPGRLTRLIRAVLAFRDARGDSDEEKFYQALIKECDLVAKNKAKEK